MRELRLRAMAGLVLALTSTLMATPAGNVPFRHDWYGPVYIKLNDYDQGTTYVQQFVGGAAAPNNVWLQPSGGVAGDGNIYPALVTNSILGGLPGEDSWGTLRITDIFEGHVAPSGLIEPQNTSNPLFSDGDNDREMVGVFWNRRDIAIMFTPAVASLPAGQTIASVGDNVEVYYQKQGHFDDGAAGSAGRAGTGYTTIGDHATSLLVLNGRSQGSFHAALPIPGLPCPEAVAQFYPAPTSPGHNDLYYHLWDQADVAAGLVPGGVLGGDNQYYDMDFYVGGLCPPALTADFYLHVTTNANNPSNVPPNPNDPSTFFDWTVTTSDPIRAYYFPEPVAMTLLALGGLVLVRRRR